MTARKNELIKNFDHLETLKFSHATVKGFTEQGLYMLATILKLATENAQAYLWCEPGNPQILFGNNKGIQRIKAYKKAVSIQRPPFCMPFIPTFFPKTLEVTREKRIFAEEKLHSAN